MQSMVPHLDSFTADLAKESGKYLIGAAAGWLLKAGGDRWRTRRARTFWRPFLSKDVRIVIGRFENFKNWEPSGLLGVGDAIALSELQKYLTQIGGNPEVVYADRIDGDSLKHTLISLGGPDVNQVTREAVKKIDSRLRFGDPSSNEIAIKDTAVVPQNLYTPTVPDIDGSAVDYGVILRAPNPFSAGKEIMILAGSFGHGTWAATRYVTSLEFLNLPISNTLNALEYLVSTDVVKDTPQAIHLIVGRSFQTNVTRELT